jgi:hypothetical protein
MRHAEVSFETAHGYARGYRYQPLPPDVRRNLVRGRPLPPGLAWREVPPPMLARLPVYPGYRWEVCGSDLVLVAIASGLVSDVLINVFY